MGVASSCSDLKPSPFWGNGHRAVGYRFSQEHAALLFGIIVAVVAAAAAVVVVVVVVAVAVAVAVDVAVAVAAAAAVVVVVVESILSK